MTGPSDADRRWDELVASTSLAPYMQTSAWARSKAANGWASVRLEPGDTGAAIGAQVLLRRAGPLPWIYAYAPRGPVAERWDAEAVAAFTAAARHRLRPLAGRVSHLRIDPGVEAGGPDDPGGALRGYLREAGWRPAPTVQVNSTRIVELGATEAELWSGLRSKWRQYVGKARNGGVRVVEGGAAGLPEFYAIYRETAARAGFVIRSEAAYRAIWDAFAPSGAASLLFARSVDGTGLATLFLVRCGRRVVEPFGGMTGPGADSRANYLLKWEAIRQAREAGAAVYDMWGGLAFPGIAQFKAGFGGREVELVGAWDLVLDPAGWLVYGPGQQAVDRLRAWRAARRFARGGAAPAPAGRDE